MLSEIIFIVLGFIFLIKGADLLVKAATSIAKKFGLSEMLIGLTVVAIGTSLPEIFITINSGINGHPDLIVGNAIGSCVCNFLLVIGISSFVKPIKLDKRIVKTHLPIGMGVMILLLIFGNTNNLESYQSINRWQGLILVLCTIIYVLYTIYEERQLNNKKMDEEILKDVQNKGNHKTKTIVIYMILGILGLKFGSDFIVDNAILIARRLTLSEKFIGLTILAIGTSLPEIVTGIVAARKNETELLLRKYIRV